MIRPGTAADLGSIAEIQAASPHASHWRTEDYLNYELWIASPAPDEDVAGFAVSRQLAPDEWELLNMAVAPRWRRTGVAEGLLRHLIQHHQGTGFLEVRASNSAAQALYQKLGFAAVGRRQAYYPTDAPGKHEEGIVFCFRP